MKASCGVCLSVFKIAGPAWLGFGAGIQVTVQVYRTASIPALIKKAPFSRIAQK
jgi:hypothetical protein